MKLPAAQKLPSPKSLPSPEMLIRLTPLIQVAATEAVTSHTPLLRPATAMSSMVLTLVLAAHTPIPSIRSRYRTITHQEISKPSKGTSQKLHPHKDVGEDGQEKKKQRHPGIEFEGWNRVEGIFVFGKVRAG